MSREEQRSGTDDSVCRSLQTCIQAVAGLNRRARMRVLNGLRAWVHEEDDSIPDVGGPHDIDTEL